MLSFYFKGFILATSLLKSLFSFLNSTMPLPIPFISSGIFFPPNNSNITNIMISICQGPVISGIIIFNFIFFSLV